MPIESFSVTGLFEGKTLADLYEDCLLRLKQASGDHSRYSQARLKTALDFSQIEAVRLTQCLKTFAIIRLKSGYSQYKPPTQMIVPIKAFFYQSSSSYWELKQKTRQWLDRYKKGWRAVDGDPLYMYPGDNYGNLRKLGFYPTPDTDGNDYTASPDTGIFVSSSGMTTTGNITGINSVANPSTCTDSLSRDLVALGIKVGMIARNVTDGSYGQINGVAGSTFSVTLTGGNDNSWDVGDSWEVLTGDYGVVVDWENNEKYLFGSEIGGLVDVQSLTGNVYLEFAKRPLPLQHDTQYPEIPPELHQYLPDGVVWLIKRNSPKGSNDYNEAVAAYQAFRDGIMGGYVDLDGSMENDNVTEYYG